MSPVFRIALMAVLWLAWSAPFLVLMPKKNRGVAVRKDKRARWGVMVSALGYFAVFLHGPREWHADWPVWRVLVGVCFALLGCVISWTAVRHLGRQWRVDAGLNADHELIRSGPYRVVRHPIYASMFCMLLTGIAMAGTLPGWPIGIALFVIGTEVRVHVEDGLLRGRFGDRFVAWQRSVPAYLPFVR